MCHFAASVCRIFHNLEGASSVISLERNPLYLSEYPLDDFISANPRSSVMPAKTKNSRQFNEADDAESTSLATTALAPVPFDAPPSFLEKPEPAAPASPPTGPLERSNLQLYLQEIGKTALLTIQEEVVLARKIRRGDKAARDHMIKAEPAPRG